MPAPYISEKLLKSGVKPSENNIQKRQLFTFKVPDIQTMMVKLIGKWGPRISRNIAMSLMISANNLKHKMRSLHSMYKFKLPNRDYKIPRNTKRASMAFFALTRVKTATSKVFL